MQCKLYKDFTEVQLDNIHSLSLTREVGHPVTEADQVGQAELAFHELMLAKPGPGVALQVLREALTIQTEQDRYHKNKLQKKRMNNCNVMARNSILAER